MIQTANGKANDKRCNNAGDKDSKALIESALSSTEKIVANLLANQKQVVLKERTPNCFVVL